MGTLQTRIRQLRKEHNFSQTQMAELLRKNYGLKTDRVMISKWETGFQTPEIYTISCIADLFNVSIDYLNGRDVNINLKKFPEPNITEDYTTFPVIGEIAAGYDKIAIEDWTGEKVDIPNSYLKGHRTDEFFVLCVKGDSMYPIYQENDKVLILKQSSLDYSGQIGAVIYEDCATLKKVEYKQGEDWLRLIAINPSHPPKKIENEDLEQCTVLGVPKLLIRDIND